YSMVIYFVKPGDTIWKIAKKYKSTISDIARINNIENPDRITPGMQLFIPKCSLNSSRSNITANA
ncbi:MAG: LysM peptidoglycan-binding domain-containing protein, partial [Clostridia bacterium]|nr:LysM peptidoglycan-binding domain-containing protein [Clostridia bacterium]